MQCQIAYIYTFNRNIFSESRISSIDVTLCARENTDEEIDHVLKVVPEVVQMLRNMSPVWRDLQEGKREYILK